MKNGKVDLEEVNKILARTAIQQEKNALQQDKIDRKLEEVAQIVKENGLLQKENAQQQKETDRLQKENAQKMKETDLQIEKTARIVEENGIQQKKNAQKMKKTDQIIEEIKIIQKETDRLQKENALQMKETDRKMKETDLQMKENALQQEKTDLQMKETDKKLNKMVGDLGNQWGVLGENLVSGNLAKRLKEKNIQVERVATNLKDKRGEFDIIAINGKEVVVVEVKCTLDPSDVDKFEKKIINFKDWWPSFAGNKTIYGAMAFLMGENNKAKERAEKRGFFVISATGDVVIENQDNFQPKVFC